MRFEELTLGVDGDQLRLRFHDRVTVLSGLAAPERQALVDSLLGALDGGAPGSGLTYVDSQGQRVRIVTDDRGRATTTYDDDDGAPAPDLLRELGLTATAIHELVHLRAADVGLLAGATREPQELLDARDSLAELTARYQAAVTGRDTIERLRDELADVEERLRDVERGRSKRRYARLLGELERVRAEAAAVRGGEALAAADARFLEDSELAPDLDARWRAADERLRRAADAFGDRQRLDARTMAEAAVVPDTVPAELDALSRRLEEADARRDALHAHLNALAASRLPEPSDAAVVRLARVDQDAVWAAARQVIDSGLRLEQESLALGGLEAEGVLPAIAGEIETAHAEVEQAEAIVGSRRTVGYLVSGIATAAAAVAVMTVALIAPVALVIAVAAAWWAIARPRRQLASALGREEDVLTRAGVPTYRSFHMRRIDVVLDPKARDRLNLAALEHRVALGQWHELAGMLDAARALDVEDEVRAYAASMAELDGAADEIEAIRAELSERAEPAAIAARAALLDACRPFGIDDPTLAVDMVRHQVTTAATARVQQELEEAEREAARAAAAFTSLLDKLGVAPGPSEARMAALADARSVARERIDARRGARRREVVEVELTRLEAEAREEYRADWNDTVTAADGEEPDADELQQRKHAITDELVQRERSLPEIARLADRRCALERRVAVLEVAVGDAFDASLLVGAHEIERHLLNRMIVARNAGGRGEPLPVLLDDPFPKLHGEKKWEVLDLIERLSVRVQVVYLTDDPDVAVWARRRMGSGCLSLLEPVAETV